MSHIDTLREQNRVLLNQNIDCERRYDILRKDFTDFQNEFIRFIGANLHAKPN